MVHGDDDGAMIPPRIAASQVVIIPFIPKEEQRATILEKAEAIATQLRALSYGGEPVRVEVESRDVNGSSKNWDWIKRGAPLRIEIGPRDLEAGTVSLARRDRGPKERETLALAALTERIPAILAEIQQSLFDRALAFQQEQTRTIDTKEEFYDFFTPKNSHKPEIHGGFAFTHWNGSPEIEAKIKEDLKVTIRCIPSDLSSEPGICPFSGEASAQRVIFAKSY
jgi:prolyl-tRNA synthetase